MKILLVEDDEKILSFLAKGLKEEFFNIDIARDGEEGLYLSETFQYDIIILDWMLPKMDGLRVCQKLREKKVNTPILILTAKGEIEDRVKGLEIGADDYLSKPFAFSELIARIKALMRRTIYNNEYILKVGNLTLDYINRVVKRGDRKIELTIKEYELLELLMRNRDSIVTTTTIIDKIWNMQESISSNVINVFIYHLRNKIDIDGEKKLIKTIRGSGYKISDN